MTPSVRDDWDRHWNEYSESAEDNPAQDYRRQLIFSLLALPATGEGIRLLDVGSGQGDLAARIRLSFPLADVLGLELSQSGVDISRRKVLGARFLQRDLLDEGDPPMDLRAWATHAVCSEVLEHVDDPVLMLKNAGRFMRPGCVLVTTVPGGPMSAFDRHIGHRKHWHHLELESVLRQAGFTPTYVSGAGFPFFNLYRCLVILRGKKLMQDVGARPTGEVSLLARAAMIVFHRLMRPHLNSSRRGWQVVAKACR